MCPNDVLTKQFLQGVLSVSWEISANKEVKGSLKGTFSQKIKSIKKFKNRFDTALYK